MANVTGTAASGDDLIDGLLTSYHFAGDSITWSAPTSAGQYGDYDRLHWIEGKGLKTVDESDGFVAPAAGFLAAARDAMAQVASFVAVDIIELTEDQGSAEVRIGVTTKPIPSSAKNPAYSYIPDNAEISSTFEHIAGDSWFDPVIHDNTTMGTFRRITFAHELGHSIGLKHGHEEGGPSDTTLPTDRDSSEFSIMTYRDFIGQDIGEDPGASPNSHPQTFMMLDIAALQHLYGADFGTQSGDTTYHFDPLTGVMSIDGVAQGTPGANVIFRTVWDGNGRDTYDFSGYGAGADLALDLSPGYWTDVDSDSNLQAALLGGGPNGGFARGQVFNALQYQGDARSLIENALGGAGDDSMFGNQADNMLAGNDGNDTIGGLDGDDTLLGGDGDDYVTGYADDDLVQGNAGDDYLVGGAGDDTLVAGAGDDTLLGFDGDDVLRAGAGTQQLDGGTNHDTADFGDLSVAVQVNLAAGIAVASAGAYELIQIEDVSGTDRDDIIEGNMGFNWLVGRDGDDWLEGRTGQDTLWGGEGDDTLLGDSAFATIYYGGDDRDTVLFKGPKVTVNLSTGEHGGGAIGDTFTSIERLVGTGYDDRLTGRLGTETLEGGAGHDRLRGMEGNDLLIGGAGDDSLEGGAGVDTISYADAAAGVVVSLPEDLAFGAATGTDLVTGVEAVIGSGFDDTIAGGNAGGDLRGLGGNDVMGGVVAERMFGDAGDDRIFAGKGDTVDGGEGSDTVAFLGAAKVELNLASGVHAGAAAGASFVGVETFEGTGQADRMRAGGAAITFEGGNGNDTLVGGATHDTLLGGAGQDSIAGNTGEDLIVGGLGDDTLESGVGWDRFVYARGDGRDIVLGFDAALDQVRLDRASFGIAADAWLPDYVVFGGVAPDAGHGYFLMDEGRLSWDADGAGPAAGATELIVFGRLGAGPDSLGDFAWA